MAFDAADDVVVRAQHLTHRFGARIAVDDVSLVIPAGQTYGLLGPNGAGKTTTISIIAGLLSANDGDVTICGERIDTRTPAPKRHIGLVPQELAIYPELSARENLNLFGRLQGMRGPRLRERIAEVLDLTGLSERAHGPTKEFSGGMKRRLNIGIGLLHQPELLILDEPTVGVDPQSRNAILESVEALSSKGMAVLYTTHYMEEAERLCDRIGIIDSGQIQAEGSRDELIQIIGAVDHIRLLGSGDLPAAEGALSELTAVERVDAHGAELRLTVRNAPAQIAEVVTHASAAGMTLSDVEITRPNLESVFLHLTGKALRD